MSANFAQAPTTEAEHWHNINWTRCRATVRNLQARIVKAIEERRWHKVKNLQHLLINSFSAKALSIRKVTENAGAKTPGVDGEHWETPNKKAKAITKLRITGYRPKPLKRIYIPKSNGKKRPLGIPTLKDRAMQALFLLALDPVAETQADRHSYGFRKHRSAHDAMGQIFRVLVRKDQARWILDADIAGCYDNINHEWLLKNIPIKKNILKRWLKAGFLERNQLYPTENGTPQGSIISPALMNMTLDGLKKTIEAKFGKRNSRQAFKNKIYPTRYADDFIITGNSKEILENEVLPVITEFLKLRGLELSKEKTRIVHIKEGFDFLGWNVRKYENNGKETLLIKPSKKSVKQVLAKIKDTLKQNQQARQLKVIQLLNPIIRGWANYHRHICAKETFAKVDHLIWEKLRSWARRRHPRKNMKWIVKKYFRKIGKDNWTFAAPTETKEEKQNVIPLIRMNKIPIKRHIKIKPEANPYKAEWYGYFQDRQAKRIKTSVELRKEVQKLWLEQKGQCPACRLSIDEETGWNIHHVQHRTNGGTHQYSNLILMHPNCHRSIHAVKRVIRKPEVSEKRYFDEGLSRVQGNLHARF